jgi:hypothetical protein
MAFTKVELQEWIKGLELSEDDQKIMLEKMGADKTLAKVGNSILAQREFSRKMDELKAQETRLTADFNKKVADEEKKSTDYMNEVGNWKKEKEKVLTDATAAREQAEARLAAVQARIKELAPTYAIPDSELSSVMTPIEVKRTNEPPPKDPDTGKFVSADTFNKVVMDYAKLPAIIVTIEREHLRLFGPNAEMPDFLALVDEATKNKKSLKTQWEEQYKVPERRAAIAKETHDAEIAAAVKQGREAMKSEMLAENPAMGQTVRRDSQSGSPVLDRARAQAANNGDKKVDANNGARGVAAAVAAFNGHKYGADA